MKRRSATFRAVKIRGEFYLTNNRRAIKVSDKQALFDGNPLSYTLTVGERKKVWIPTSTVERN